MVEVSNNFIQECEANVGAYKFGKIKVNYIDDNPLNYEQGAYSSSSGAKIEDNQSTRSVNLVECKPSFKYKIELGNSAYKMKIITYTEAQAFIATHDNLVDGSEVTTEATAKYLSVTIYSTDILEGTSILLNGTSRSGALTGAELKGNTTQNGTPTPTTPIEVNNVTGEQVVRVCGKNLYNPSYRTSSNNIFVGNGTAREENGTFTLTATDHDLYMWQVASAGNTYNQNTNGKLYNFIEDEYTITITNQLMVSNYITFFDENFVSLGFIGFGGVGYKKTFKRSDSNVPSNAKYFGFRIGYNHAVAGETYTFSVQLEVGTSSTIYEPYQGKDYEVNLGKNLFDKDKATTGGRLSNVNGTIYAESGYFYSNFIKVEPSTSYTKNSAIADVYHRVCFYSSASESGYISKSESNTFTTPSNCQYIRFCGIDTELNLTQLEKNNVMTSYSPYFTPIELNKIGDYQDFIRKGTGKNLVENKNIDSALSRYTTILCIEGDLKPSTTYAISFNGTNGNQLYPNENLFTTSSYFNIGTNRMELVLTTKDVLDKTNSAQYNENLGWRIFKNAKAQSNANVFNNLQIEENSNVTYYEPYGYKDKWYIEKNIGKVILDGSRNWTKSGNTNIDRFVLSDYVVYGDTNCFSNYFDNGIYSDTNYTKNQIFLNTYSSTKRLIINYSTVGTTTLAQFKTWLQTNNTKVYYVLAIPTYTLIENEELIEQLDAVSHAETQEGITNILVSGNLPATLEVERDLTDSIKGRQLRPFVGYSITGDDDLISFKITGKADSSKSFIGSCVTKQIDLEIFNAENKHNLENKQIIVSTGMAETAGNFVTFEPFTITGTKDNKTKDRINYIGYDDMFKLNTAYVDTNTYGEDGITLYSFLESLASNANTSLGNESIPNGDFIVDGNPFTNNETNMFALSQIAKLSGGFAEIGRDNKIYIKTLDQATPTMTLDTNLYSEDFEKAENFGAVNKVVVGESNISGNEAILSDIEDIELNGEHVVEILDSYFLSDDADKQIICAELFDKLKGLYYLPFSATCNGFPYLDLGDMIQIEDKNGETYLTYLLNYELSYSGGYKEKIGAEAQSSIETKYKNVNTIKDKFKQVEIDVDKANAQIKSIIKTNGKNYSAITQTIGGISTEVQTATTSANNALTAVGNLAQGTQRQFNDLTEALSSLRQSVNNIQALFRVTGGANLIQNSVGFFQNSSGAPTMWNVSQGIAGFKHGYDSELLGQTTSQGKFYIRNGTISTTENDATLETEANISGIEIGSLVTLSFKYKQSADSTTTITLTNGETTFFTATFSEEVEDWTSYSDADNTNSFTCTTDSLVLTITNTSTYNTDDQGFMISDLILNYGEEKTWELHSGESYGGVIQLSSQGISVKSSSANTITYMTSDGIEVFETTQGDVLGDLITKLTSNGIETKDFVATGDITTRNLITTMIKDTNNNDIYIEYIRNE